MTNREKTQGTAGGGAREAGRGPFVRSDAKNVQAKAPRWAGVAPSADHGVVRTGMPARAYEETYTCICCPLGCRLTVMLTQTDAGLDASGVVGYKCKRGKDYARQEATHPVRMVTAAVPVRGRLCPVSVKTQRPVPKNRMQEVLERIRAAQATPPVREGDTVLSDVCGTGIAVVATKTVE